SALGGGRRRDHLGGHAGALAARSRPRHDRRGRCALGVLDPARAARALPRAGGRAGGGADRLRGNAAAHPPGARSGAGPRGRHPRRERGPLRRALPQLRARGAAVRRQPRGDTRGGRAQRRRRHRTGHGVAPAPHPAPGPPPASHVQRATAAAKPRRSKGRRPVARCTGGQARRSPAGRRQRPSAQDQRSLTSMGARAWDRSGARGRLLSATAAFVSFTTLNPLVAAGDDAGARPPQAEQQALGRQHFRNGVKLFQDGNYSGALAEFEAAYRLKPSAASLQNIALSLKALFRYSEAAETLNRLLARHGSELTQAERTTIREAIDELSSLVGTIVLRVQPTNARI